MRLYQSGLFGNAELSEHDIVYGDIWALGAHLVLVGDATNSKDIARLMRVAHNRVSAIVTDPPYGKIRAEGDTLQFGFIPYLAEVSEEVIQDVGGALLTMQTSNLGKGALYPWCA